MCDVCKRSSLESERMAAPNKKKTRQKRQTEGHEGQITSHAAMMLAAPAACFTVILVSFITLAILNVFIRCFKMF